MSLQVFALFWETHRLHGRETRSQNLLIHKLHNVHLLFITITSCMRRFTVNTCDNDILIWKSIFD